MPTVSVGDRVLYVPHEVHHLDFASTGALFHYRYTDGAMKHQRGLRAVETDIFPGATRSATGLLFGANQQPIAVDGPKLFWPAVVIAVNADGTPDLQIAHPDGTRYLTYPDREGHPDAPGIRYDATKKTPHSFHLPGD